MLDLSSMSPPSVVEMMIWFVFNPYLDIGPGA